MTTWKKTVVCAAVSLLIAGIPASVSAVTTTERVLYGAAAILYVSRCVSQMDDKGQAQYLSACQEETGVCDDEEYNSRVRLVYDTLRAPGDIKREYKVYVAPGTEINAFMSLGGVLCVNKGTLDAMDDDELAYVMAHELAHGEKRHPAEGVKKQVGLTTALDIYLADNPALGAQILGGVCANYVSNAVFTKDQEKEADAVGFTYLTAAGYNPGGAAAAMEVLLEKYGDNTPSGIKAVLSPGNHPHTSERVQKNIERMYLYSGKKVNVKDGVILVNGVSAFRAAAMGNYSAAERSYLTAGKLARLYHDGKMQTAVCSGDGLFIGGEKIYTLSDGEDGNAAVAALNQGISKG